MGKSLKKKNKIKNKTLKKGGFNTTQLTAAIAICSFLKFDKIRLQHTKSSYNITLNYIPLSKEIIKDIDEGGRVSKSFLGKKIYTLENRNLLIEYNGEKLKDGEGNNVKIGDYDIWVDSGEQAYKISGGGTINEIIDQFRGYSILKRGGNKFLKKGGAHEIDNFVFSSCNNGNSIIATSVITQQNNVEDTLLTTSTAQDKLLISSIERPEEKIKKIFSSKEIDFDNDDNLLFLSYAWGISTLAANNLKLISKDSTKSLILKGAKNNIEKATGIKTNNIPVLTL